jgi:hypothetical protein
MTSYKIMSNLSSLVVEKCDAFFNNSSFHDSFICHSGITFKCISKYLIQNLSLKMDNYCNYYVISDVCFFFFILCSVQLSVWQIQIIAFCVLYNK